MGLKPCVRVGKGYAYPAADVYYAVRRFAYGKLSGRVKILNLGE